MGTAADQAAGIKAVIEAVENTGKVYDYQPVPVGNDWAEFVKKFTATIGASTQVRAFTVAYLGEEREYRTIAIGATKIRRNFDWLVRCYLGWHDPDSEATFRDALVEPVATAIDAARSLNGTALDHDPVQVNLPNDGQGVSLGGVLCHYAEFRLRAWTEDTLATS